MGASTGILCSLRWHYPDQVKGLISARTIKAPHILCKVTRKSRLIGNKEKKITPIAHVRWEDAIFLSLYVCGVRILSSI